MSYSSPFGDMSTTDHYGLDALCLSRTHCTNAVEDTLVEFHQAAVAAIAARAPQPAFFLARHLAELGLKALHAHNPPKGHNLAKLLDSLADRGDELLGDGQEQQLVVMFVRDLHRYDTAGDEGRYSTNAQGVPSLATVCCADSTLLRQHVDRLYGYVRLRIAAAGASAEAVTTAG